MILSGLMLIALTMTTGSLAVSSTEHPSDNSDRTEVVAVGEHAYVVDKKTGKVWEVDLSSAEKLSVRPAATEK